jgi:hypothetical protein
MKMKSLLLVTLIALGLTASTIAQNVPNYVPTNGLVGWWPFNGNANDESGNGNNGTVYGASQTTDRFGNVNNAYLFQGGTDRIAVGNINSSNLSVSCWILKDVADNQLHAFVSKFTGMPNGSFEFYEDLNGNIYFQVSNDGVNGLTIGSPSELIMDNWINVMGTYGNDTLKLYINGILRQSYYLVGDIFFSSNNILFGATRDGINSSYNWHGKIDDIGIWNRALTQQEITDLYNGNTGITGFNSVAHNNTIKIFPNPANDQITIDYGNIATVNGYQLKIQNSIGQQVFQTNITQQTDYLSLNKWGGNGLYFVHIIDAQGNTIDIRKIVLQ